MKVRAITAGVSLPDLSRSSIQRIKTAAVTLKQTKRSLESASIEVQSIRLATGLISHPGVSPAKIPQLAVDLQHVCKDAGISYASIGRLAPGADPDARINALTEAVCRTDIVFASVDAANTSHGVNHRAVDSYAQAVMSISKGTANGFGNLRFAVVACGPDVTPYFPTSFSPGDIPSISICLESPDIAIKHFHALGDSAEFVSEMERTCKKVSSVAERALKSGGFAFAGIDLSPAPYPSPELSVGTIVEQLSGVPLGEPGTLAAVEAITSALRKVKVKSCGFNGLMLPVLEDSVIAKRVQEGRLDLQDLLLYSTVCGTGLDTIPLPGRTSAAALARIMTDVCSLAVRLNKPLTARLMPVPGKKAGDMTAFDFPYFVNTKVMSI